MKEDPPRLWKMGEWLRLSYEGRTVKARVILAAGDGRSLALEFEALMGGYAGMMPVLWNPRTERFECMVLSLPVTLSEAR